MVDRGNLDEVQNLYNEYTDLTQVLDHLQHGGRITNMTIAGETAAAVSVRTDFMAYPQPMVDAIRGQLQTHQATIRNQLVQLGVNMDAPAWNATGTNRR